MGRASQPRTAWGASLTAGLVHRAAETAFAAGMKRASPVLSTAAAVLQSAVTVSAIRARTVNRVLATVVPAHPRVQMEAAVRQSIASIVRPIVAPARLYAPTGSAIPARTALCARLTAAPVHRVAATAFAAGMRPASIVLPTAESAAQVLLSLLRSRVSVRSRVDVRLPRPGWSGWPLCCSSAADVGEPGKTFPSGNPCCGIRGKSLTPNATESFERSRRGIATQAPGADIPTSSSCPGLRSAQVPPRRVWVSPRETF